MLVSPKLAIFFIRIQFQPSLSSVAMWIVSPSKQYGGQVENMQ